MTLKTSLSEPVPAPPSDRGQWAKPWPVLLMVRELNLGGCERDLTKIALGLDRTLFEPHVGCFHPEGFRMAELQAGGVPVVRFPVTSFGSLSAFTAASQLGDYMRRHRIRLFLPRPECQSLDPTIDPLVGPVGGSCRGELRSDAAASGGR